MLTGSGFLPMKCGKWGVKYIKKMEFLSFKLYALNFEGEFSNLNSTVIFCINFIQTVVHIRLKTLRRFAAQIATMNQKFVQRIAKEVEEIKSLRSL